MYGLCPATGAGQMSPKLKAGNGPAESKMPPDRNGICKGFIDISCREAASGVFGAEGKEILP